MTFPYIKRTLLALLFLGISIVVFLSKGSNPISIIGGVVGFLLFSYNFKKIIIPIIFLIIFLIPLTLSPISILGSVPFFKFYPSFGSHNIDFSHPMQPVKSIPFAEKIEIDGPGFLLVLDKNKDDIEIPEGVIVRRFGNVLNIKSVGFEHIFPFKLKGTATKKIIIGTKIPLKELSVNTMGVRLTGDISVENLSIDGMGIDIKGILDIGALEADGMGIKIHADIVRAQSIEIDGMGADLDLNYKRPWNSVWYISVNGMGSKIKYTLPSDNPGKLKIERNGLGNVVKHYGN